MTLLDRIWWRFKDSKGWQFGIVRSFPAEGLVTLDVGHSKKIVSEEDIEWKQAR